MQSKTLKIGLGPPGLAVALRAIAARPCFLCSGNPDGMLDRCVERYSGVSPIVVLARGVAGELAFVPLVWDGVGEVGCPLLDRVGLLRPEALAGDDDALARVLDEEGGDLLAGASYLDDGRRIAKDLVAAAAFVAWDAAAVWPIVDADALGAHFGPPRTLVDPGAPRYGRWPAPWVPWISLAHKVPWSEPPFGPRVPNGAATSPAAAFRAVGLPAPAPGAHPLTHALLLAAFLRSAPWGRRKRSIGGRLVPPAAPEVTIVGICRGTVYRLSANDQWRPLFPPHLDGPYPQEIEQALGHARMADALAPSDVLVPTDELGDKR